MGDCVSPDTLENGRCCNDPVSVLASAIFFESFNLEFILVEPNERGTLFESITHCHELVADVLSDSKMTADKQ